MEIVKVNSKELIETVVEIAGEIWRRHYSSIISIEQIEYMLEKFQSFDAVSNQIKNENYQYFLMRNDENSYEGFFAVSVKDKELFLSKIYIKERSRKKGYAKQSVEFIKNMAAKLNLSRIALTVNRANLNSIEAYKKMGFVVEERIDAYIGNGYEMNDYKMAMEIKI
ncbi:MAG: GNAT family N-acetyltransferase [Elusimicrobiota bacterium]|jgi:RimJ/RimL family protein N-acetyltransferase|nr:GNAT family N-acetyltransferase [Elusimicrobiota bacterium]